MTDSNTPEACSMDSSICAEHEALVNEVSNMEAVNVPAGHPIDIMKRENSAFIKLFQEMQSNLDTDDVDKIIIAMQKLMSIHSHYGKKEGLFMPILFEHGVTGPSNVMWKVDDEIKLAVRKINKKLSAETYNELKPQIIDVINRVDDMINREEMIFLPISFKMFTQKEWLSVYRDMSEYGYALITDIPKWSEGEKFIEMESAEINEQILSEGVLHMPTGEITLNQLKAVLKLLPIDITFIDTEGNIKFFINEGGVFPRPKTVLNRNILLCHPPQIIPMIEKLFADFKTKKRRRMDIWKRIKGKPVSVQYAAVYDKNDEYIGTVEIVQDFTDAFKHFADK